MNSRKANNVINILINELKLAEKAENDQQLSKQKGICVAKSFLNINSSAIFDCPEKETNKPLSKEKIGQREKFNKIEKSDEDKDEENISESEKKFLEFYDEKIDDYDEEYVNKKYRFSKQDCDSSLCCCGCFTPVCYQSQSHNKYVNQYRSLYAVNVKIDEENVLDEDEINSREKQKKNETGSSEINRNEEEIDNNSIIQESKKKNGKKKQIKYHAVFCINCNNHIAFYEIKEKVFHFFDVLPD